MFIKLIFLLFLLCFKIDIYAASLTYDMEDSTSSTLPYHIHDITLYPEGFIEWSESGGSPSLFNLWIHVNEGRELNEEFWAQLGKWTLQIIGIGFINHDYSVHPTVHLESLKILIFPRLTNFLLIGVNPSRPFIDTFQNLSFCENLKSLRMFNCGRLDSSPGSSDIIGLEQIYHLVRIPSLRNLRELDLDLISSPEGLAIIDASPYIKRSQCIIGPSMSN